ncbi:MAG: DUF5011 domain-containing protein [Chitinophagales bacterium]|nr:DUF5011 domain-containing protein [Chitinophagales bacterium]
MKRRALIFKSSILSLGLALVLASCGDDDLSTPVITITGADPLIINLGDTYTELGAEATDDTDGDLTASITTDATGVNTNEVAKYTVTYTVTDEAGNEGVATRDVWVRATADDYVGFFTVSESCAGAVAPYEIEIEKINETTLRVINLGDFTAGATVLDMEISGDLYQVLSISDVDDTDPDTSCDADGALTQGLAGEFEWNMSYTFITGADSFTCDDVDVVQN